MDLASLMDLSGYKLVSRITLKLILILVEGRCVLSQVEAHF